MRTEWEKAHILSYKDIDFASRFFDIKNIKHWHLFSIAGIYFPSALHLFVNGRLKVSHFSFKMDSSSRPPFHFLNREEALSGLS
jgi:hypothetical protein